MTEHPDRGTGVLEELKRRKVVRAALVYGAGAFAVLQVADIVLEPLGLPGWVMTALIWLIVAGFPVAVLASWFFDVTQGNGVTREWLSSRSLIAVGVLITIGVGVGWLLRPDGGSRAAEEEAGLDGNVVVVLPFTVLGSDQNAYLSDAVAKLLSASLDGSAGLRTVSPHALMGYPDIRSGQEVTQNLAQEVSQHFGAGLWLMGDVVEAGDSLRIDATLVDATNPGTPPLRASVTSGEVDLFASVDELATLLIAEREAGSGATRMRTAALTTSSLEALRAYIEGERAFRAGSYLPAVTAFTNAIEADSAFALAFYRLSMTEERLAWAEDSRRSAESAYRHAQRLSPREREFLEAVVALRRGNTSEAEQLLRTHVREHPDDPEAWYQLGEILFHGEPLRGGSMTAARQPLETALVYDPGDLGALYHLVRIAVEHKDVERIDSLTARFVALSQGERTLELRALRAASQRDEVAFDGILEEMNGSPDPFLPIAVWSVATFGHDPASAERIARVMTGDDRPIEVRGAGHTQLAHLALAQGRYTEALSELAVAEQLGDPDALEARAWFATLPFVSVSPDLLLDLASRLDPQTGEPAIESPRPSSFFSAQNGVHGIVRRYLAGSLYARLSDEPSVQRFAVELDEMSGTEGARELARQLALGLRVQAALWGGATERAEQLLDELSIEGWYELTFVSPYYAGASERFALAESLYGQGREEEALRWYEGLRQNNVAELVFAGPALLREATIHRRAGQASEAAEAESEFERLWSSADPELLRTVREMFGS